jgi:hypothetical protein
MILITIVAAAQSKHHDSLAILIVDRMSDVIGDLESCSFKLQIEDDVLNTETGSGLVKKFTDCHVYMSGQNKMYINTEGDIDHRQMWYNGEQLAYYFGNEKNYGILWAPPTTIEMIDTMNALYNIDFPAADFFYPSFTDDLLQHSDTLKFLGMAYVNGQESFHLIAINKEVAVQFWIVNNAYNLPLRFVIVYKNKEGNPQYQGSFSEWQINPNLPAAMFDFQPPPGSALVRMVSKNGK